MTLIFAIETSCDETAAALIADGQVILSNCVASQIDLHAQYGGVFPELASRAHVEAISPVIQQALAESGQTWSSIDAIAVTAGPGLPGSLLVGLNAAKGLALATGRPLLGVNHLEGHLYSLWLVDPERPIRFPALALIVSGGHTELILMRGHGDYLHLGGTLDDAAGEAFDKVGRLLGLPYPGGPSIQKAALEGDPQAYKFPRAQTEGPYDFSFSGLKTAVMRTLQQAAKTGAPVNINDAAASFQAAVVGVLVEKTLAAAKAFGASEILLAGGVSANQALRAAFAAQSPLPIRIPPLSLCTDNAAMIGAAAYYRYIAGERSDFSLDVRPNWPLA
jgi:N6-L-threonylcarbamoyladenine synthase